MQLKRIIFIHTAAIILLVPQTIYSGDEPPLPWEITADRITHQQQPKKILAEGNVFLKQYKDNIPSGLSIQADKILYDLNENQINGSGNLRLFEKNNEVRAAKARINLVDQVGFFEDASIFWRQNNLYVSADRIEKTDETTYHI
ncbi:LPS export ABC transporter periplasmic protein LptC, partial [Thermodesulfobacteriota bacterium]